jgi:hypothetical protein
LGGLLALREALADDGAAAEASVAAGAVAAARGRRPRPCVEGGARLLPRPKTGGVLKPPPPPPPPPRPRPRSVAPASEAGAGAGVGAGAAKRL